MRIGILTFHSQTNYGGILQAVSLQNVLRQMGHDVVVINRYMYPGNMALDHLMIPRSVLGVFKLLIRILLGLGDLSTRIRNFRSRKYIERHLSLTSYGFYDWKDAPKDLGVDLIVVGSDQVWRAVGPGLDPKPYLLCGAPRDIPAIAYAASFGMHAVPDGMEGVYADGFKRFRAISTREAEGKRIVELHGSVAEHVVDPTLLNEDYFRMRYRKQKRDRKLLLCYFVFVSLSDVLPVLNDFCRKNDVDVEVFVAGPYREFPYGKDFFSLVWELSFPLRLMFSRVKFRSIAIPSEFLSAVADADWVITDSFHGTMFSTIFRKNFRVLNPSSDLCKMMFSRISEFTKRCVIGDVQAADLSSALHSLLQDQEINYREGVIKEERQESRRWLETAIGATTNSV